MQLSKLQQQIAETDLTGDLAIKGKAGSGKTTTGLYRAYYLKENKCTSNGKVLFVTYTNSLRGYIKKLLIDKFPELFKGEEIDFYNGKIEVYTIGELTSEYFKEYCASNNKNVKTIEELKISRKEKNKIKYKYLDQAVSITNSKFPEIGEFSSNFLLDEFEWIMVNGLWSIQEYQVADRIGRIKSKDYNNKLHTNSESRRAIWNALSEYYKIMTSGGHIDWNLSNVWANRQIEKEPIKQYEHVIVDESQDLTKLQFEFIKHLTDKSCANITTTYLYDETQTIFNNSWFISKKRSFQQLGIEVVGKRTKKLNESYRVNKNIIKTASFVLNIEQPPSIEIDEKEGAKPILYSAVNEEEQNKFILSTINDLNKNLNLNDILIISKRNDRINVIQEYLSKNNIESTKLNKWDVDFSNDTVRLCSFHSAKGIESKAVILDSVNEDLFPDNWVTTDSEDWEIEKNLLYVGMTRASELLYVSYINKHSKFFDSIPSDHWHIPENIENTKHTFSMRSLDFDELPIANVQEPQEKSFSIAISALQSSIKEKLKEKLFNIEEYYHEQIMERGLNVQLFHSFAVTKADWSNEKALMVSIAEKLIKEIFIKLNLNGLEIKKNSYGHKSLDIKFYELLNLGMSDLSNEIDHELAHKIKIICQKIESLNYRKERNDILHGRTDKLLFYEYECDYDIFMNLFIEVNNVLPELDK